MKKLEYGRPIIHHAPGDTLRLSILAGKNNYSALVHNMYNIWAPEIVLESGIQILDVKIFYDLPEVSVKKVPRNLVSDIIDFIENAINQNCYLLLNVDSCKISAYQRKGSNRCYPHEISIYGIDSTKKTLLCADFFDGKSYGIKEVSYKEFLSAIDSLDRNSKYINFETGGADWIRDIHVLKYLSDYREDFNVEKIINNVQQFLDGKNIDGCRNCTYKRPHIMAQEEGCEEEYLYELCGEKEFYGIEVFENVLNYYINYYKGNNKYVISSKLLYIIYAYNKLMEARLGVIKESRGIELEKINELIFLFSEISKRMESAINIQLMYEITESKKYLERIIRILRWSIEQNKLGLEKFLCLLNEMK